MSLLLSFDLKIPLNGEWPWQGPYRLDQTWIGRTANNIPTYFPAHSTDWPLTPAPYRIEQTTALSLVNMLGKDVLPFGRTANEVPRAPFQFLRTWELNLNLTTLAVVQFPFHQTEWPLTQRPYRIEQTWAWNQVGMIGQDFLLAGEQSYDLTPKAPPRLPLYTWEWRQVGMLGQDRLPIGKQIYDLTIKPPPRLEQTTTWRQVGMLGQDVLPENQYDWPLPKANYRLEQTWVWRQVGMLGQDTLPKNQYDWQLPIRAPRLDQTWALNLNLTTLAPTFQAPFNQYDWPLPKVALRIEETWAWNQTPMLGQDRLPVGARSYELPVKPAKPIDQTWIWRQVGMLGKDLLVVGDQIYDLPPKPAPRLPLYSWEWRQVHMLGQDQLPVGEQSFDRPILVTQRPATLYTWIQSVNLALNTTPAALPFNQYDWPLPTRPRRDISLNSWTSQVIRIPAGQKPFAQYDWPLPTPPRRDVTLNSWAWGLQHIPPFVPPPIVTLPNIEHPWVRDWWDRDEWGNFYPGSGIRRG